MMLIIVNPSMNSLMRNELVPSCQQGLIVVGESEVPVCLSGASVCPLQPLMMNELANGKKSLGEKFFGYSLSSARMVIKCAPGRLRARFGCFRKSKNTYTDDLACVIYLFCVAWFLRNE